MEAVVKQDAVEAVVADNQNEAQPDANPDHSTVADTEKQSSLEPDIANAFRGFTIAELFYLFNVLAFVVVLVFTKCRFLGYFQSDRPDITYMFQRYTQKQALQCFIGGAMMLALFSWMEHMDPETEQYCYVAKEYSTLVWMILGIAAGASSLKQFIFALIESNTEKFSEIKDSRKKVDVHRNQQFIGMTGLFMRLMITVVILYSVYLFNALPESFVDVPKKITMCVPAKVNIGMSNSAFYILILFMFVASVIITEAFYKENKPFRLAKIVNGVYFIISTVLGGGGWIVFLWVISYYDKMCPSLCCLFGILFLTSDAINNGVLCVCNMIYTLVEKYSQRNRYAFWPGSD